MSIIRLAWAILPNRDSGTCVPKKAVPPHLKARIEPPALATRGGLPKLPASQQGFYWMLPYMPNSGRYTDSSSTNTMTASTTMIIGSKIDMARPVEVSTSLS